MKRKHEPFVFSLDPLGLPRATAATRAALARMNPAGRAVVERYLRGPMAAGLEELRAEADRERARQARLAPELDRARELVQTSKRPLRRALERSAEARLAVLTQKANALGRELKRGR